jgi:hypothetical protein
MTSTNLKTPPPAETEPSKPESDWVKRMHAHFKATGQYRPEDLQRVLGDPRRAVSVEATEEITYTSFLRRVANQ